LIDSAVGRYVKFALWDWQVPADGRNGVSNN
jgi:hypothetical protein